MFREKDKLRVALVYDWVHTFGGAERILLELHHLFPEAPLFTTVYYRKGVRGWANVFRIQTSFLQHVPLAPGHHELLPIFTPIALENFDFSDFDIVISLTSSDAKGIITKPQTLHICYMLTPTRYLWSHQDFYFQNKLLKLIAYPALKYLKTWDLVAARRPDCLIAISRTVQKRISKYYGRESAIVYPPVAVENFVRKVKPPNRRDYYLVISRLVPFKRVDLAIQACNKLKLPLVVVGEGRAKKFLKRIAGKTVFFRENLTEEELVGYYQNCRAVIVPAEEDFGLVSVEAQAAGKPVIAYGSSGAKETVKEGLTGIFFQKQETQALIDTLTKFSNLSFSSKECQKNSQLFSRSRFRKKFSKIVDNLRQQYFRER